MTREDRGQVRFSALLCDTTCVWNDPIAEIRPHAWPLHNAAVTAALLKTKESTCSSHYAQNKIKHMQVSLCSSNHSMLPRCAHGLTDELISPILLHLFLNVLKSLCFLLSYPQMNLIFWLYIVFWRGCTLVQWKGSNTKVAAWSGRWRSGNYGLHATPPGQKTIMLHSTTFVCTPWHVSCALIVQVTWCKAHGMKPSSCSAPEAQQSTRSQSWRR